jgi:hypothetical protein
VENSQPIKVTKAFITKRVVLLLSNAIPILVGIGTHTEVDLVDINLVKQLALKPCQNQNLPILCAINQQDLYTYGAYNLRLELVNSYRTYKTTLRPYLTVNRPIGDS